jgi:FAD/FMN-containing dehydrogenase
VEIIRIAQELKIPWQILGAGTKINLEQTGLIVKNRTSNIKVSGVKGKVGAHGIGVEEALVEADSGISLGRLNKFLEQQNLLPLYFNSPAEATLGGSLLPETQMHQFAGFKRWGRARN